MKNAVRARFHAVVGFSKVWLLSALERRLYQLHARVAERSTAAEESYWLVCHSKPNAIPSQPRDERG